MSAATLVRGAGTVYSGSHTQYHGATCLDMVDCVCAECFTLEPFDPARRCDVVAQLGAVQLTFTHSHDSSWVNA